MADATASSDSEESVEADRVTVKVCATEEESVTVNVPAARIVKVVVDPWTSEAPLLLRTAVPTAMGQGRELLVSVIVNVSSTAPVIVVALADQAEQLTLMLAGDASAACAGGAMSPAVRSAAILAMPRVRRKERESAMKIPLSRCTNT